MESPFSLAYKQKNVISDYENQFIRFPWCSKHKPHINFRWAEKKILLTGFTTEYRIILPAHAFLIQAQMIAHWRICIWNAFFFHFRCLSNKLERIPKKLANLGLWFFSWMKNSTSFLCCFINSNVTTKSNDPKMKRMEMKQFPTNWTIYHWKFKLHYVNSREYRIERIFSPKSTKTVDWARIILAEIMFLG